MGCGFCTPVAAVTLTTTRWDDAVAGQNTGANKVAVPTGSRRCHIVTNATVYYAFSPDAAAYSDNGATALHASGAPIYANNDADSPVVILDVPVDAAYLHILGASVINTTFFG